LRCVRIIISLVFVPLYVVAAVAALVDIKRSVSLVAAESANFFLLLCCPRNDP
jgi:hypothetical protein